MKRFNSVFTIALSIDHWKEDASDVTMSDIIRAMRRRVHDACTTHPMETLTDGPDDTTDVLQYIDVPDFGMVAIPSDAELGRLPDEDVSFPIGSHLRMTIWSESDSLHWKLTPAFDDETILKTGKR